MTAAEVAARMPGSRKVRGGWLARCPAHGDRNPSLSVSEGREGRVLLRCRSSNCEPSNIVVATGLEMRDLFATSNDRERTWAPRRQPTQDEIRAALLDEEKLYRNERGISDGERLVAADINAIRHAVAVRLGISLPPVQRRASDSHAGGRERDELWPVLLERAWRELWIEHDGRDVCCAVDDFAAHGNLGFRMLEEAEQRAALQLRAIARQRTTRRVA